MALIHKPEDSNPKPTTPTFDSLYDIANYSGLDLTQVMNMPALLKEKFETVACIGEFGVYVDVSVEAEKERLALQAFSLNKPEYKLVKEKYAALMAIKRNKVLSDLERVVSIMTIGVDLECLNAYQAMKLITQALGLVEHTAPILRMHSFPDIDACDKDLDFHPGRL